MKKLFLTVLMAASMQGFAQESAFLFENGSLVDELDNTNSLVPADNTYNVVTGREANANSAIDLNGDVLTATKVNASALDDFSISFWMKTSNDDAVGRTIVQQRGGLVAGNGPYGYRFYTADGDLHVRVDWVGYRYVNGTGNYYDLEYWSFYEQDIADGLWHHIVLKINPASASTSGLHVGYELWIDNALADSHNSYIYPNAGTSDTYRTVPDQVPLQVGDSDPGNGISPFIGSIDDIRLYESVLTTTEVDNLYARNPRKIYVDKTATGNNDGTDWANAYNELRDAMQGTVPQDTFWVAQGTYKPHASDRQESFDLLEDVAIYGGFNGTETQLSQRDWHNNETIISGDLQDNDNGNVAYNESTRSDNTHRLFVVRGNGVLIDGLTIESGHANLTNNNTYNRGAAVYKSNDVSDFKIKNSTIRYNVANREGTMYLPFTNSTTNNSLLIESCDFYGNFGRYAAGFNSATNVTGAVTEVEVYNSRFFDNEAGDVTPGDGLSGSCFTLFANQGTINATLVNNTFAYNQNNGNNMSLIDAAPVVLRRLDNAASDVINLELHNNIFWGNTVNGNVPNPAVAIGLANRPSNNITSVNVSNNVIDYGTLANRSVSITPVGPYNADTDPDFADGPNGNLRLTASSWVLDLGDNSKLPVSITKDVEGGDRVLNTTIDFGAHEYNPNLCNPPVAINTQPSDETACPGDDVTLSVAAAGNSVAYQWQLDGVDISGATSSSLTINGVGQGDVGDYTVVASDACNDVTSSVAAVDLNTATSLTTQPSAAIACAGTNTSFSVSANGSNLSYQWKLDGTNLSGETSATLNVNGVSAGDAGNYTVEVTGDCGTETSNVAALTVNPSTAISSQPSDETLCAGGNASFSVLANGSNLSYQWKLDGTNLLGETSTTLNVNGVSAGDAGNYTVEVSGDCGTETSNVAALAVNPSTAISSQPSDETLCTGDNASFSVSANGSNLSYQWKLDGTNLSGETSTTLDVNGVSAGDAGNYTVEVSGDCGTETSNVAALTVNPSTAISSQPSDETLCAGGNASFSVSADGANLSYQWKLDGTNLSGETSATLNVNGVSAGDAGNYTVEVSGDCGTETSNVAALAVYPSTAISSQPSDETLCTGDNASFSVSANGSNLSYQWKLDGTNLSGETSTTLDVNGVSAGDAGNYTVEVSGDCGTETSNVAALTVNPSTAISSQPSDESLCAGDNASFSVTASGSNLSYQWKLDGTNLSGETSATLDVNGVSAGDAGNYTVEVSGDCGTETSSVASLTVNEVTAITAQPSDETLCAGDDATLSVTATGENLSYQWVLGSLDINGETAATLELTNVGGNDAGSYTVEVTGTCGTVTSDAAAVQVFSNTAITQQPSDITACEGTGTNSFQVIATGTNVEYQWYQDGVALAGETSSVLNLGGADLSEAGIYTVDVIGACGTVTSDAATLTVNEETVITSQPTSTINFCEGSPFSIEVQADGSNLSYQWLLNGNTLSGETQNELSVAALSASDVGEYTVEVSGDCGTETSTITDVMIIIAPSITAQPNDETVCEGESVTLAADYESQFFTFDWLLDGVVVGSFGDSNTTFGQNEPGGSGTFELELTDVELSDAGSYTLEITGYCVGHDQVSDAATLTVNELPEPVITDNMGMLETGSGFDTYQWYLDGNILNGETSSTLTNPANGDYTVEVSSDGCVGISAPYTVVTVSIADVNADHFNVYPNPFTANVNIDFGSYTESLDIQVIDMSGRIIHEISRTNSAQVLGVDLSSLKPGAYSLRFTWKDGTAVQQLLIKN